jgi:16S rRNA C967 or C1407 C5-methylase (RsmB/RsmF family)/NOL1/NOP2/fmu family ribosome biogenesis protein
MFPEAFRQRIIKQKYIDADKLLHALACPSPVTIRINRKKWNKTPGNSDPVLWCRNGFYLEKRPSYTLDPLFHAGCYYPQEASGMFIEEVYRQTIGGNRDLRILDLCGAPGGKATHLSTLIGDNGYLVANEVIRSRASVLAENLTKWGLSNSIVTQSDPSAYSRLPGFFDMILADAPCSGEGMFRDKVAVDEWSVKNAALCSERQKRILADVWPALKEDGILIYSTCTFNPDENEKNIKWLTDNKKAESIRINISDFQGITEIDYNGIFGYGFYPGRIKGEGLFISVLRKTGEIERMPYIKGKEKVEMPDKNEINIVSELSHFSHDRIIKVNDRLISIPCSLNDYSLLSGSLKIIKPGTLICTLKKKNCLPSHELALSVYFRKSVIPEINFTVEQALNYLRKEAFIKKDLPEGWLTACYNGISLGFMNNIGRRINNYYPVEWRIRMNINDKGERNIINWINRGSN